MKCEKIAFQESAMQPIFERFQSLFAPYSAKTQDIAPDVKLVVWKSACISSRAFIPIRALKF